MQSIMGVAGLIPRVERLSQHAQFSDFVLMEFLPDQLFTDLNIALYSSFSICNILFDHVNQESRISGCSCPPGFRGDGQKCVGKLLYPFIQSRDFENPKILSFFNILATLLDIGHRISVIVFITNYYSLYLQIF